MSIELVHNVVNFVVKSELNVVPAMARYEEIVAAIKDCSKTARVEVLGIWRVQPGVACGLPQPFREILLQ